MALVLGGTGLPKLRLTFRPQLEFERDIRALDIYIAQHAGQFVNR
jgi:hypothetical protein